VSSFRAGLAKPNVWPCHCQVGATVRATDRGVLLASNDFNFESFAGPAWVRGALRDGVAMVPLVAGLSGPRRSHRPDDDHCRRRRWGCCVRPLGARTAQSAGWFAGRKSRQELARSRCQLAFLHRHWRTEARQAPVFSGLERFLKRTPSPTAMNRASRLLGIKSCGRIADIKANAHGKRGENGNTTGSKAG